METNLTIEEQILLNQEVKMQSKNVIVAYIVWATTGIIGGHRYFMGKTGSAIAMTLIVLLTFGIGAIATAIWAIVDAMYLYKWIQDEQQHNKEILLNKMKAKKVSLE
ncbi:TM2 domain-containing protein [Limosilactobacillus oris]|uniref:TM2 domain-containing protein n=1 Tax=Limosilactobacillus oris TaxID=1632 RepID=UPI00242CE791|nr:TM2 domain-containing protein [Limosilactobacillus oris]